MPLALARKLLLAAAAVLAFSGVARGQPYGAWVTGEIPGVGHYAATGTEGGNMLGQYCFDEAGRCAYLLGVHQACEPGKSYPVFATSDTGSQLFKLYCSGRLGEGRYQYLFASFDEIHLTVLSASWIGFSFPPLGDEFTVVRFSLVGSNEAIARMLAEFAAGLSRSAPAQAM